MRKYLAAIILACVILPQKTQAQDELAILEKSFSAIDNIHQLSYTVHLKERIEGELSEERTGNIKMTVNPLKVYYYQANPRSGAELLFNREAYGNNILINPNGFPWFTFTLAPDNKWMRKSRHHTILDAGFEYIKDILGKFLEHYYQHKGFIITNLGKQKINNSECYILSIEKEVFFFKNYTLNEGEDISNFAKKEGLSDFMILERNPRFSWYDCPKPGETIIIPNYYAKKVLFFIDSVSFLPVSIQIYDDIGLFEEVTFSNINTRPMFTSETFSKDNPEYNF